MELKLSLESSKMVKILENFIDKSTVNIAFVKERPFIK